MEPGVERRVDRVDAVDALGAAGRDGKLDGDQACRKSGKPELTVHPAIYALGVGGSFTEARTTP
jgi:hypothetical protein